MKDKRLQTPSNIRFSEPVKKELHRLSRRFGVTASDLVRNAVIEKIRDYHKQDAVIFKGG
jgi:predicted DNA-binding protein